jgi:NAD+ synthetase
MGYNFITDYEKTFNNIVQAGMDYLNQYNNIQSLVLGLSGGIDSAVTCVIAKEIITRLDREITLRGYALPGRTNYVEELTRGKRIGLATCTHFRTVPMVIIGDELKKFVMPLLTEESEKNMTPKELIRRGNLMARTRMIFLYDRANKYNGIVLSTDNYTEFLLGFWTLHGDVGDLGLIQNLWKTEVYGLANWMTKNKLAGNEMRECIEAMPTDGLGVTACDLDQIIPGWEESGNSLTFLRHYHEVDKVLMECVSGHSVDLENPVVQRHISSKYKRNNPVNIPRSVITYKLTTSGKCG